MALPVMEAICFPVRACLLIMRLEAAASAVVGLSLPPSVPVGGARVGGGGGGGEATGGIVRTPDEGTEREETGWLDARGTAEG